MANALILNLPGGRLTIGPMERESRTLNVRIDTDTVAFQMAREVMVDRTHAVQIEEAFNSWLEPEGDRRPSTDLLAEQRVLGTVLRVPLLFDVIFGELHPSSFADPVHGAIWEAIGLLHANDVPPDTAAVSEFMEPGGKLAEAGGSAYLVQLGAVACDPVDAVLAARQVRDAWRTRSADAEQPF